LDQELDREHPEAAPAPTSEASAIPQSPLAVTEPPVSVSAASPAPTVFEFPEDRSEEALRVTEFESSQPLTPIEPPRVESIPFIVTRPPPAQGGEWNGSENFAEEAEVEEVAHPQARAAQAAGGPNLMLALVCWVAAATSLFEAFALYRADLIHTHAFTGYLALGVGVLLFSVEALAWARSVRRWLGWLYLPAAALTILGVVSLVLSHAPGRRI